MSDQPTHPQHALLVPCPACERTVSREALACPNCGHPVASSLAGEPSIRPENPKEPTHGLYVASLVLAILAVLLGGSIGLIAWTAGIVGLTAVALGPAKHRHRWMAWTALGSGMVFSVVNAAMYGHLG